MTPERWQKVEELFEAVVGRSAEERTAFLAETCAGDESLRRQVEALLASDRAAEGAFEEIASGVAAEWTGEHDG
ncbi:MAG: hypothetical protein M3Z64_04655, partial [Verrucomicrobiota bacterium]|nr:hypothetical protein [Verrucomicrobiota bacterium]